MSACDELEGRPSHQVTRFHAIAPRSAAKTLFVVAMSVSMIPLPMTSGDRGRYERAARLATDATRTASRGESACVETEVATAFAVSWKPFVKSNPRATTTTTTSSASSDALSDS